MGRRKGKGKRKVPTKQKKGGGAKKAPVRAPAAVVENGAPLAVQGDRVNGKSGEGAGVGNGVAEGRWRVVGLANLKNTCYFNSVMQLLLSSTALQEFFSQMESSWTPIQATSLTSAMTELFRVTQQSSKDKCREFKPNRVLTAIRSVEPLFKGRGQHDAHELMITVLHHLVEESKLLRDSDGKEENEDVHWMDSYFGGKLMSNITCMNCSFTKSREEDFLVLSVSVLRDDVRPSESPKAHPLFASSSHSIEVPDVVEREDSGALQHLRPSSEASSAQNNLQDDGPSGAVVVEEEDFGGDDVFSALHDLFDVPNEESDNDAEKAESVAHLSHMLDTSLSLDEKDGSEFEKENNELMTAMSPSGKGKRKGKQKNRKKANRFEILDFEIEACAVPVNDSQRLRKIEESLQQFFSSERVTWRCTGEFPEKKVTFAEDATEVFEVPSICDSRSGHWKCCYEENEDDDAVDDDSPEKKAEATNAEHEPIDFLQLGPSDLKSCLKKENPSSAASTPTLNSLKQYFLWKAPRVLCIHLKRFEALGHRRISKLNHAVKFDMNLNLNQFVASNSPFSCNRSYKLRAVVCHTGSVNFGHYTAFVSRSIGEHEQWYDVSDSDVRKATASEVLKSQAYILLYEAQAAADLISCPSDSVD